MHGFEEVTSLCLVKFTLGGNVDSEALCDVITIEACRILVSRPWLYDNDMIHRTRANTYSFQRDHENYTLHPHREEDTSSSKHNKVNGFLTATKFETESQGMGVMYV